MELPRARRYRSGNIDRLYVNYADGTCLGWIETDTGELTAQIPGSEARIEAAVDAWSASTPDDDLATHAPGRDLESLAHVWDAEIRALEHERTQIDALIDMAHQQRSQFARGTSGEYRIGELLNSLYEDGWGILHSLPAFGGASDIDHLLIGPGGVWTVNSKSHAPTRVFINGDHMTVGRVRVDYIRAARREADYVTRVLRPHGLAMPAQPLVALDLPMGSDLDVRKEPDGVIVATYDEVLVVFESAPAVLEPDTIHKIFAAARWAKVWE